MKNAKKGFTLVELLIVIAILAILATVAIVGYTSYINKAQLSVDQQLATQMNTLLEAEAVLNTPTSVDEVLELLEKAGLDTEDGVKPSMTGYTYYWYQKHNVIVLVNDEDGSVFCPVENKTMISDFNADYAANKTGIYSLAKDAFVDPNLIPDSELPGKKPVAETPKYKIGASGRETVGSEGAEALEKISGLYTFRTPEDEDIENSPYKNWIADFAIIINDDIEAETAGILGSYWGIPWQIMLAPEGAVAGTTFLLMQQGFEDTYQISYEFLDQCCSNKNENGDRDGFHCGAFNLSKENLGKSITVELRLYEVVDGERTGRYIVSNKVICQFNDYITREDLDKIS